ncbi:MAG: hypothetical protein IPN90_04310 [Elusimicrobia bacterium]|nr:hypothetical protein [Elusimicrobiota bacterium]
MDGGVSNAKVLKDSRVNDVDYENQRTESMTKNVYGGGDGTSGGDEGE